jgi:uncharacterized protein YndB with AHSA1/START domain
MASFTIVREIAAPPERVFELLVDHRRYAEMTRLRSSELEREGDPPPNGAGAIRVLRLLGPPMREEILTYEPPRRFSYTILSGLPVRDHVGTVELSAADGGTSVTWAVRSMPTLPVGGAALLAGVRMGIRQLLDGVAAEAERLTAAPDG